MIGNLSIVELFAASPTMLVLLVCSIITLGFAIERLLYFKMTAFNAKKFMRDLAPRITSGNHDAALDLCRSQKGAVGRVMGQALRSAALPIAELKQRIDTAIEVEQVEMERNLGVLGTMSNIAPLLGLFGTVVGIIRAFADIARTGSGGSSVVAMGVSEALMTTAAGIIVAVIATIFFNTFIRRIRTRTVALEDVREEFFRLLGQGKRQLDRAPAGSAGQGASSPRQPAPAGLLG